MRVVVAILLLVVSLPASAQFRALRLSGKVVFKDGSIPPKETIVRLYCPDGNQPQAYVDSEGAFLFSVGGNRSFTMVDSRRSLPGSAVGASGPDQSFVSMSLCVLRAYLPGYTSSRINLGRRSVFESTDVGVLVLTPGEEPPGETPWRSVLIVDGEDNPVSHPVVETPVP